MPITQFAQLSGKRLSIGKPGTAIRPLILQVLKKLLIYLAPISIGWIWTTLGQPMLDRGRYRSGDRYRLVGRKPLSVDLRQSPVRRIGHPRRRRGSQQATRLYQRPC